MVCVTRAVHLDEEIHEDAHRFIPDRYLKIDAGQRLFKDGKEIKDPFNAFWRWVFLSARAGLCFFSTL